MAQTVNMDDLEAKVFEILRDYIDEATRTTKMCVQKVARAGVNALKGVSPRRTGAYASNWAQKTEEARLNSVATVYNKEHYRLTHLLENGHDAKNQYGGPWEFVSPYVHIAPVEETIIVQFETELKIGLSK